MKTDIRRRGTAIVDTDKGILVVAGKSKKFLLPGGKAERFETRSQAAMRELFEETNLRSYYAKPLFNYEGFAHNGFNGKFQDIHTVCLIKFRGHARPRNEISYIDYYTPGKNINLSKSTKEIIDKYFEWKSENTSILKKLKRQLFSKRIYFKNPKWVDSSIPRWIEKQLMKKMPTGKVYFNGSKFKYKLIYFQDSDNHWSLYNYVCYRKPRIK